MRNASRSLARALSRCCKAASPKGGWARPSADQRRMANDSPSVASRSSPSQSTSRGSICAPCGSTLTRASAPTRLRAPCVMSPSKRISAATGARASGCTARPRAGPRKLPPTASPNSTALRWPSVMPSSRRKVKRLVSVVQRPSSFHHSPLVKTYVAGAVRAMKRPSGSNKATASPPPVAMATRPVASKAKLMARAPCACNSGGHCGFSRWLTRALVASRKYSVASPRTLATMAPPGSRTKLAAAPGKPVARIGCSSSSRPCAEIRHSASSTPTQTSPPGVTTRALGPWMAPAPKVARTLPTMAPSATARQATASAFKTRTDMLPLPRWARC